MNLEERIQIVKRQTSYSYEEAKEKLEENDNNYERVIRDALGIKKREKEDQISRDSINQSIYANLREFMDSTSSKISSKKNDERKRKTSNILLNEIKEEEEMD